MSSCRDNFKRSNIHIIGVPEGEEKEQEIGNLFEKIMKENFLNLGKEIDMQVQEAQRIPNKMNPKRPTRRYIIIKMPSIKDRDILKSSNGERRRNIQRGKNEQIPINNNLKY